jgi:ZIP family zinc transporter
VLIIIKYRGGYKMIIDFLIDFSPIIQALLATLFTWFVTALGAAVVFFFKDVDRRLLDSMLGFAAGIMIAASFWSLLAPAIEISENQGVAGWIPAVIGFLMGGVFLRLVDMVLPHLHPALAESEPEGIKTNWQRSVLLVLAVTLHNFPEGLAVGVAFGAVAAGIPSATIAGAVALAVGIGLQNFPEGAAVSIPLKREGLSAKKSFMYGQFSGAVEPIAGVLGAAAVYYMRPILPYALAFAAGAMIFVVGEELIPEANSEGNSHLATTGLMLGFAVMMFLDVSLG